MLIPGTTLQVRCPVNPGETLIWERGDTLINRTGRIKVNKRRMLHIKRSRENKDAGVYRCLVNGSHANITVSFHSKNEAQRLYYDRIQFLTTYKASHENSWEEEDENAQRGLLIPKMPIFYTGQWSSCSRTCGGAGLQVRNVTCEIITENFYKQIGLEQCEKDGMQMPLDAKDCGFDNCPQWEVGEWGRVSNI